MDSLQNRWVAVRSIIERGGPFQRSEFEPNNETIELMRSSMVRILVIGAGGLGCELLKDLALMGFRNLDVIDMDTVDVSNLNRQFLFRTKDIGRPKAETAASFIMERISDMQVTAHYNKIQDFDDSFYRQFGVIVCGLDSIVARRWINGMLTSMVRYTDDGELEPESVVPMVEGGTEGFKGNARVILPGLTPCVECTLDLYPPQINFPLCTLAHTPRLPEHCVEYVRLMVWPKIKPFGDSTTIDGDNPEHLDWIFKQSVERAKEFGIGGVTMRLTQGVVKRIIPAVASTNAVVAAACATEVFKLVTFCHDYLNNYMNFNDTDGVYTYTFEAERKEGCIACSQIPKKLTFPTDATLQDVIDFLKESGDYQMTSPSVTTQIDGQNRTLFMNVASMKERLKPNLDKKLTDLGLNSGSSIFVADVTTPQTVQFRLVFNDMSDE